MTIDEKKQQVFHVSPSGDDSNCGDREHPFLTIARACEETLLSPLVFVESCLEHHKIDYIKSGSCLIMLCPFHEEKTPSMCYRIKKQDFHCVGCAKTYSIDDFFDELKKI